MVQPLLPVLLIYGQCLVQFHQLRYTLALGRIPD